MRETSDRVSSCSVRRAADWQDVVRRLCGKMSQYAPMLHSAELSRSLGRRSHAEIDERSMGLGLTLTSW
jgi:hypothetical protein